MKNKYSYFVVTISLIFSAHSPKAQTLVNTTGNTLKSDTYYFEYSIGEIAITTISGNSDNATQGVLQPNVKKLPPPCDFIDNKRISFENPTHNMVRIVGQYDWITSYQVFASDGKLIAQKPFYNNVIDLSVYPAAVYFIKLFPGCDDKYRVLTILKQ